MFHLFLWYGSNKSTCEGSSPTLVRATRSGMRSRSGAYRDMSYCRADQNLEIASEACTKSETYWRGESRGKLLTLAEVLALENR